MSSSAVVVRDLVKDYGSLRAVDGVSFSVASGEVFALLGPNGAGKSSTVEILEGYRSRSSGVVEVLGFDPASSPRELRDRTGIVLQSTGIENVLTVREAVSLYGGLYRRRRPTDDVIALVGLQDKAGDRISALSGGQRRRVDLALALVGDPELIFLDEPTTGFDPAARRSSWDLLDNLKSLGRTIVLTTHFMDEAQHLADRVAVISRGRIVAEGRPDEIGGRAQADAIIRFRLPTDDDTVTALLGGLRGEVRGRNGVLEVTTSSPTLDLHRLTSWAIERGVELAGLSVSQPTLEDVYLELTGE